MQMIPLTHIIFYLAMLFLPNGTAKFTVTSGSDQKITWVHQAKGAWQATTADGKDAGLWSADGFVVTVTEHGNTSKTDVSQFVRTVTTPENKKMVAVLGKAITVSNSASTITFSKTEDGASHKPLVISYSSQ
jgi:hypothetical protein